MIANIDSKSMNLHVIILLNDSTIGDYSDTNIQKYIRLNINTILMNNMTEYC